MNGDARTQGRGLTPRATRSRTPWVLDCITKVTPDFKTLRDQIVKKEIKGLFRSGWQMDYPSIENFLAPLYATGASSNDGDYSNPKFDAKLKEAAAAPSLDQANKLYQEAEAILGKDLPVIPMWSYHRHRVGPIE